MKVTKDFFNGLQDFGAYFEYIKQLFEEGKTTGDNHSEAMLNYTKLGISRIKRGLKTFKLSEELIEAAKNHPAKNWLIIQEAWCGDAANTMPVVSLLADQIEGVNLKVMLRDEHPEVMENYLTNGGKAIPIFLTFDADFNQVTKWGPRPQPAQDMVMENKNNPTMSYQEFSIILQKWYQKDKTATFQEELVQLFKK